MSTLTYEAFTVDQKRLNNPKQGLRMVCETDDSGKTDLIERIAKMSQQLENLTHVQSQMGSGPRLQHSNVSLILESNLFIRLCLMSTFSTFTTQGQPFVFCIQGSITCFLQT
jgi:hypothetical protein